MVPGGHRATCTDQGATWQYNADAVVHAEGNSADELGGVIAALEAQTQLVTEGPGTFGQDAIADGEARGLDVRIRSYDDSADLIINVYEPCKRIAADRAELEGGDIGEQILDIGGTHPNQQDAVP